MEVEGERDGRPARPSRRRRCCCCNPPRMSKLFKAKEVSPAAGPPAPLPVPGQAYRYTQEIAQMVRRLTSPERGGSRPSRCPRLWSPEYALLTTSRHAPPLDRCLSLARSRIPSARPSATSRTSSGARSSSS